MSPSVKHVIKVSITLILTTILVDLAKVPLGLFSIITVMVLMLLFPHELIAKAVERIVGSFIGCALALGCLALLPDITVLIIAVEAAILFCFMLGFSKQCFPYASLFAALLFLLVMVLGTQTHTQHLAFGFAKGWMINVVLGSLISWVANTIPWPKEKKLTTSHHAPPKVGKIAYLHAGKTTFVVMLLVASELIWNWPGVAIALQALIAAIIISELPDYQLSHQRVVHRFIGVLVGLLYGLLIMEIHLSWQNQALDWAMLSLGYLGCCMVTFLWKRYFYIGLQAGVMLPIVLFLPMHMHHLTASVATARLMGAALSAVMALVILHFLWPATHRSNVD